MALACNPQLARAKDPDRRRGWLPLHMAVRCLRRNAGRIVRALLKAYPEGAGVSDYDGNYPIHSLANYKAGSQCGDMCRALLEAYPAALRLKERRKDCTPLSLATNSSCLHGRHEECILMLLKACPEAAAVSDGGNELPFRSALYTWQDNPTVLIALLEAHPEAALGSGPHGPALCHVASTGVGGVRLLSLLLELYPDKAKYVVEHSGMLALHLACKSKSPCAGAMVPLLLSAHPGALHHKDTDGSTPLMIAEREKTLPEDVVALLRKAQEGMSRRSGACAQGWGG